MVPCHVRHVKKSASDKIFDAVIYTLAFLMLLICLYPMYFIVIASFSDPSLVGTGQVLLWPKNVTFVAYKKLIEYPKLWIGYRNTILYTIVGTIMVLAVNIPAGFVFSRKELPGRKWIMSLYLIPMFFGGGLIPTYMVVRDLHLLNTFWVIVVPFAVSTYYIIVSRTFFMTSIPEDLWDSARIDGCNVMQYFRRIVLPLSKAVLSVIGLWAAVGQWNSYFTALIYVQDENLVPLQLVLRSILINNQATLNSGAVHGETQQVANLLKYAVIVVSSAPIMCLYPFVQKYFNQGVMLGSVKG